MVATVPAASAHDLPSHRAGVHDLHGLRLMIEIHGMRRALHDHLVLELWTHDNYLVGQLRVETVRRLITLELERLLYQTALRHEIEALPDVAWARSLLTPTKPEGFTPAQRLARRAQRRRR